MIFCDCIFFSPGAVQVFLEDRSLMPGDVVARKENGREKVCGYCRNVKTVATVRILDSNLVIENVKSEDLQPLEVIFPYFISNSLFCILILLQFDRNLVLILLSR